MMGMAKITKNTRYMTTNAPPPYWPVIYGKRQTLPNPIAHPALMSRNPSLLANFSLCMWFSPSKKKRPMHITRIGRLRKPLGKW